MEQVCRVLLKERVHCSFDWRRHLFSLTSREAVGFPASSPFLDSRADEQIRDWRSSEQASERASESTLAPGSPRLFRYLLARSTD